MKIKSYRSFMMKLKEPEFYTVVWSVMLLGKNIYNATLFLLHNFVLSYNYDTESKTYIQKENLHSHQIDTIKLFNQTIKNLNEERLKKYHEKSQEELEKNSSAKIKEFTPVKEITTIISVKDFHAILSDKTLIENVLKLKETTNNNTYVDYTKIHSFVAQYATYKAIDDVNNYFKSLIEYFKSFQPGQLANVPRLPKYLNKNERLTIELNHQRFSKKGKLFSILKHHVLYNDFFDQKNSLISQESITLFNQLNLKEEIVTQLEKRLKKNQPYELKTVRFVPQRVSGQGKNKYPFKVEVIVDLEEEIKEDSFLAYIVNYYDSHKSKYKKPNLSYDELTRKTKDQIVIDYIKNNFTTQFNSNDKNKLSRVGGLDLGSNNTASLAFSHGKNQIYCGKRINQRLTHFNTVLDSIKSSIFESNLSEDLYRKVKYNQSVREQNNDIVKYNETLLNENDKKTLIDKLKLEVNELQEIKLANQLVYSNLKYIKTLVEMNNYKNNILHQLSDDIITRCVRNHIQCLIIGHNEGWKEQLELNKKLNRLFSSVPYQDLITMVRYKGEAKGLVVLETEESYTSQSSFINNDILPTYQKSKIDFEDKVNNKIDNKKQTKKEVKNNDINNSLMDTENNHSHQVVIERKKKYRFSGKRNKDNRHEYKINSHGRVKKIHADLNGAFNIIRKICVNFKYHELISLDYELRGIVKQKRNKGKKISVMFSLLPTNNLTKQNLVNQI